MVACIFGMQLTTSPITPSPVKKSFWHKGIPTLLGLGVLVVGLVVGVVVFGSGTGVFAPRASAESTPKNIKVTNITDRSFSVTFETDVASSGFVKYGTSPDSTKTQIGDDRDQITGTVKPYPLHQITVSGLDPQTKYYFVLGTNSSSLFDDEGKPFEVTTAKRASSPPPAKTIYGSVLTQAGGPAAGALVFIRLEGAGELSALVRDSGSWAVPLSNARTSDGSTYASITPESALLLIFKGSNGEKHLITTTVDEYENGQSVTFGQTEEDREATPSGTLTPSPTSLSGTPTASPSGTPTASPSATPTIVPSVSPSSTPSGTPRPSPSMTATGSANLLGSLLGDSPSATASGDLEATQSAVVDLDSDVAQVVTTDQPIIQGSAPPKVKINIKVHSDTQIEGDVYSDENGEFEFDISAYAETLEPGEHTIEYTYIDPATGQEVLKTKTFTVAPRGGQQLALASSPTPRVSATTTPSPTPAARGTSNPYVAPTASASASASSSATATAAARSALPSTASGVPASGSVGTTWTLILGGLFFLFAGGWSWWIASELKTNKII